MTVTIGQPPIMGRDRIKLHAIDKQRDPSDKKGPIPAVSGLCLCPAANYTRLKISEPLVPPKPNELERAYS
ncbi:MAG: hypothetical protein ACRCWH_11175, partial [Aeromonas veronii]